MKKTRKIILILFVFMMLVSCNSINETLINNSNISDMFLPKVLENPKIVKLKMNINHSNIYSIEGELVNDIQVYSFRNDNDKLTFSKSYEEKRTDLDYLTPEKLEIFLADIKTLLNDKYKVDSYKIRLFANDSHISIESTNQLVYKYSNGQFVSKKGIPKIETMCFLIFGGETALIVLME